MKYSNLFRFSLSLSMNLLTQLGASLAQKTMSAVSRLNWRNNEKKFCPEFYLSFDLRLWARTDLIFPTVLSIFHAIHEFNLEKKINLCSAASRLPFTLKQLPKQNIFVSVIRSSFAA